MFYNDDFRQDMNYGYGDGIDITIVNININSTLKTEHHENDANYEKATVRKQFFRVIDTISAKRKLLYEPA